MKEKKDYLLVFWISLMMGNVNSIDWGYDPDNGPSTWPGTCKSGKHQSPIDINPDVADKIDHLPDFTFHNYDNDGPLTVKNFENSVKILGFENWEQKRPYVSGGPLDENYLLKQIHFHWSSSDFNGSEHTINGKHYSAEVHLVHEKNGTVEPLPHDGLAVFGVLVEIYDDKSAFSIVDEALENVVESGKSTPITKFKPKKMFPAIENTYYTYNGSLTTPGCNESVIWTIFEHTIYISRGQMNLLRQIKSARDKPYEYNFRPTQALNSRHIKYNSSLTSNSSYGVAIIMVLFALSVLLAAIIVRKYMYKIRSHRQPRTEPQVQSEEYDRLLGNDEP